MKTQKIPHLRKSGVLVITPGAESKVDKDDILKALVRHFNGDWGELSEPDWKENDEAAASGGAVLSRYVSQKGTAFWIATGAVETVTTVLLPEER